MSPFRRLGCGRWRRCRRRHRREEAIKRFVIHVKWIKFTEDSLSSLGVGHCWHNVVWMFIVRTRTHARVCMCKYIYVCMHACICVCLCMYITVHNMCTGRLSCTEATERSSRAYVRACVRVFVCGCEYVCLCMYITVYNMSTGRFSCTEPTGRSSSVNNWLVSRIDGSERSSSHSAHNYLLTYGSIGHRPRNATVFCPWPSSPFLSWCIPSPSFLFPCFFARCFVAYLFGVSLLVTFVIRLCTSWN